MPVDKDINAFLDELDGQGVLPTPPAVAMEVLRISQNPSTSIRDVAAVVGKDPACQLFIPDATVSREHFAIERRDKAWMIVDLDSTNGTLLNGTRIKEAFVKPGGRIQAGKVELMLQPATASRPTAGDGSTRFGDLTAASPAMNAIFGLLRRTAASEMTILLKGETGVGKSAIARAIHDEGSRRRQPFVVFDCTSVAPTLVESALFGAEKGAYTGSVQSRPGAFEQAQGGTLLLDDVEDLPLDLQPKLLRAIEEKEVRRLGATKSISLDVRMIAASKVDLAQAVGEGRFRRDLYYRIAVMDVEIPSLRQRREDIPLLFDHFAAGASSSHCWARLGRQLQEDLRAYAWPGNLRELRNVQERIQLIGLDGVDRALLGLGPVPAGNGMAVAFDLPFKEAKRQLVDTFERLYLQRLLERHQGSIAPAARAAGLNRKYLYDLLEKLGLHRRKQ